MRGAFFARLDEHEEQAEEPITDKPVDIPAGMSAKAALVHVLKNSDRIWLTAGDLKRRVEAILGREVPMSTISPTLSNLKSDGVIVRSNLKVAHAERVPLSTDGKSLNNLVILPKAETEGVCTTTPPQSINTKPSQGE